MTNPYYEDDMLTLHHGNSVDVAATLEPKSVQTIVTSPPYFGLRDYGSPGEFGAEATPDEFVSNLVDLFRGLRSVLSDDGTLWLNLGDSYGRGKQLLGIPWRVAFGLQDDGWILRSDIIWAKPNGMPESVTDRVASKHEHIFMFAKQADYQFDLDPIRVAHSEASLARFASGPVKIARRTPSETRQAHEYGTKPTVGKNPGNVWTVPTVPFSGAHFATYPPDLIRPCVRAGSRPGDTVLDPFSGSGTTGMVALQEGRRYVGIDLNRDYLDLSLRTRFESPPLNFGATA